jgi:hypothetical protein
MLLDIGYLMASEPIKSSPAKADGVSGGRKLGWLENGLVERTRVSSFSIYLPAFWETTLNGFKRSGQAGIVDDTINNRGQTKMMTYHFLPAQLSSPTINSWPVGSYSCCQLFYRRINSPFLVDSTVLAHLHLSVDIHSLHLFTLSLFSEKNPCEERSTSALELPEAHIPELSASQPKTFRILPI